MAKASVFLDSSILISAALSSRGGSYFILDTLNHHYEYVLNEYVLDEVTRILKTKFYDKPLLYSQTLALLSKLNLTVLDNPSAQQLKHWIKTIEPADAPILVSALEYCDYLLTLDNDFFQPKVLLSVDQYDLQITKPQQFIEQYRLNNN